MVPNQDSQIAIELYQQKQLTVIIIMVYTEKEVGETTGSRCADKRSKTLSRDQRLNGFYLKFSSPVM